MAEHLNLCAVDQTSGLPSNLDQGRIVELRFFAGMTVEETAEALGISVRTVKRDWRVAKAWLKRRLNGLETSSR